jgi:hypothetical protein
MPDDIKHPLPPANIESLFYMLATSAMVNLGLVPDPINQKTEINLELAKHNIDTLGILQKKTAGNLTDEESKLLDELLYDLRMKYVRITSQNEQK